MVAELAGKRQETPYFAPREPTMPSLKEPDGSAGVPEGSLDQSPESWWNVEMVVVVMVPSIDVVLVNMCLQKSVLRSVTCLLSTTHR